ncbi:E3 UFM1-protein ligase 1-like [Dermacentor silvarum]|uniref:E3 UFM1-protein ligase 1-like n=1 Tax=Dermacentor silvarum TaxID=543639 RepID=UPI00189917D3|nr:E3 UFM1-protein ligase 1-like [Dermacentor silvarum]
MATDWEEVKRLAADFQRAQLSTTVQRLSERNCIEIVKKLIELKLIDVVFTNDGKEYITPKHLQKEILDELTVAGGRINMVDLAHILNVDLCHVEARCADLVRTEHSLQIVLGQLIDRSYLDSLAEDINEKLQQAGHITFGEITKQYDLPPDFLEDVIHSRLGTVIQGQADPHDSRHIFTDAYLTRHKYRVRGALSAAIRPVTLSSLVSAFNFPDKLLYGMIEELLKEGRLAGTLVGGRSERASYVPDLYSRSQANWVDACYRQNGFLEYDAMTRLGIPDPKAYIRRHFKDEPLVFLKTICIGQMLLAQVEAAIDEAAATGSWVDVAPLLPSVFSAEDVSGIVQSVLKSRPRNVSQSVQQLLDTIIVSDAFVDSCVHSFDPLMTAKAELDSQKGVVFLEATPTAPQSHHRQAATATPTPTAAEDKQDKKDERRKKATGGKSGGGTQGRETKTKAVKQKKQQRRGRGGGDSDSEDDAGDGPGRSHRTQQQQQELEFMTVDEMRAQLEQLPLLRDCPPELSQSIAEKIHRPLTRKYQEVARSVFLASSSASGAARRKTFAELQEKVSSLLLSIQQFDRGIKALPAAEELQSQLAKHLLRTLCSDLVNLVVSYLAAEHAKEAETPTSMAPEVRQKLIQKLPGDVKGPVLKLHQSLSAKTLEDFLADVDVVLGPGVCDMIIRSDKKKERQWLLSHRQALLSQLSEAEDAALCLHLAVLLVAQAQIQKALHASGRFVPQILSALRTQLTPDTFAVLHQAQELVMRHLTLDDSSNEKESVTSALKELVPKLKEIGTTYKKQGPTEE